MAQWQIVFFISAGIYIFCASFYNLFGSGERQPWDNPLLDEPQVTTPIQQNGNYPSNQTTINLQSHSQTNANSNGVHETRQ